MIELAGILAGPAVGTFLAEMGADVIKVENPNTGGDPTRGWRVSRETSPEGQCAYFCSVNWGKRSVALDLSVPQQRERLHRLLPSCDILLVNFKPPDAQKLDLVPQTLVQKYPRLIVGWITGYGCDSDRGGFDILVQAESGFMSMTGPEAGPPCRVPVAIIDLMAAHQLKEALLLALLQRERDGRGRVVEVSLWQTALASLSNQGNNFLMAGYDPRPTGTEHPNLYPYGTILGCSDGEILLAVGTDRQFAQLCQALGHPALAEKYACNAQRVRDRASLGQELQTLARPLLCEPLLGELRARGVPSGQLQTVGQALQSETAVRLLLSAGPLTGVRSVAFSGFEKAPLRPPPKLGEHTQEILG